MLHVPRPTHSTAVGCIVPVAGSTHPMGYLARTMADQLKLAVYVLAGALSIFHDDTADTLSFHPKLQPPAVWLRLVHCCPADLIPRYPQDTLHPLVVDLGPILLLYPQTDM